MPLKTVILLGFTILAGASALAAETPDFIVAALADPHRSPADREQDQRRKPAETLLAAGVRPGMAVAELLPGGGYYTRILSRAVGSKGKVIVIPWSEFESGASRRMSVDPRYGNIELFDENLLGFRPKTPIDMVFTTQNYHDFQSPQRPQINQVLFRALKPGGTYFILDHSARDGSGYRDIRLHRIDKALVRKEVEAAGFVYAGESDALADPADDRTKNVFDPAIRGHTDQFMLKFIKPEKK